MKYNIPIVEEWIPAKEDTPTIRNGGTFVTDDVVVLLENGLAVLGFYNYHLDVWHYSKGGKKIKEKVMFWRSK